MPPKRKTRPIICLVRLSNNCKYFSLKPRTAHRFLLFDHVLVAYQNIINFFLPLWIKAFIEKFRFKHTH